MKGFIHLLELFKKKLKNNRVLGDRCWHHLWMILLGFSCFRRIDFCIEFLMHFGCILDQKGSLSQSSTAPFWHPFGDLFRTLISGCILVALWIAFASILGAFGSLLAASGSPSAHFGSLWLPSGSLWFLLVPFWFPLAPFWLPLALFWLYLASLRLSFGSLWLPFGTRWLPWPPFGSLLAMQRLRNEATIRYILHTLKSQLGHTLYY